MAERVGIRSRAGARGAGHPMKGAYPLQNPRFDSHPLLKLLSEGGGATLYRTAFDIMAERVGIRSRAAAAFALPLGGQAPSRRRFAPVTP